MVDSLIFPPTNIKFSHCVRAYAMGCGTSGASAYVAHADPQPAVDAVDAVDADDVPVLDAVDAVDVAPVQGWLLETSPGTWEAVGCAILMSGVW